MSIISWNCRGAGGRLTVSHMKRFVHKLCPSILFLMETKRASDYMEMKRMSMNFQHFFYVPPTDRAGGLGLWWVVDLPIKNIGSSRYNIDVLVSHATEFLCTFVHAPCRPSDRKEFWEMLGGRSQDRELPSLIIGDCNAVLHDHEKMGRHPVCYNSIQPFHNFVFNNELIDIGCKGDPFTWTNNQQGEDLVKQRLDRALYNLAWFTHYNSAVVTHKEMIGSDHALIQLCLHGFKRR
ncbi:hypothetical protein LINGRAPRIM_LOCUS483 [Linum grandiflorum]